ncbi:unnamed protein product [Albugo candida]|uniref:Secreted protein n=1 Tax=Albugo candida TaxID=65357 RepID=A0A024GJD6_9STRA|nr:unnamed protein product [Albugo candida]|eukprot:CCI46419.1 unnamed protein product [Albugo candida]
MQWLVFDLHLLCSFGCAHSVGTYNLVYLLSSSSCSQRLIPEDNKLGNFRRTKAPKMHTRWRRTSAMLFEINCGRTKLCHCRQTSSSTSRSAHHDVAQLLSTKFIVRNINDTNATASDYEDRTHR